MRCEGKVRDKKVGKGKYVNEVKQEKEKIKNKLTLKKSKEGS